MPCGCNDMVNGGIYPFVQALRDAERIRSARFEDWGIADAHTNRSIVASTVFASLFACVLGSCCMCTKKRFHSAKPLFSAQ